MPKTNHHNHNEHHSRSWPCEIVPLNVPADPGKAQEIMHSGNDVFLVKVSKVNAYGTRKTKMELELVTPKATERKTVTRIDTRETQFEEPCTCCKSSKEKKANKSKK